MPPGWLQIRRARTDLTDYLVHWTRWQTTDRKHLTTFEVLKLIIACGYLKPSYAPRPRVTVGGEDNTIKGLHPAVCFTEQPLDAFIMSCNVSSRYQPYSVAVHKWHLFTYGGRPVVYGDENLLQALPDDHKYLWVRYHPMPDPTLRYPVDWTHEREWRARQRPYHYLNLGLTPAEGVPLLLPPVQYAKSTKPVLSLPRFLVRTRAEADELREWIKHVPAYAGTNSFLKLYFELLPKFIIIPLDEVDQHLKKGDAKYARLETLPYTELDHSLQLPTPEAYI